jgi:hypothetical protein
VEEVGSEGGLDGLPAALGDGGGEERDTDPKDSSALAAFSTSMKL